MTGTVSPARRRATWAVALGLLLAAPSSPLFAQRGGSAEGRNTAQVLTAFKSVTAKPAESTVRVLCDGAETALGTVVSADGFIVTKLSDLKGKIVCRLHGGRELPAKLVGAEEKFDLAMLKVEAKDLRPVQWRTAKPEVGDWVVSVDGKGAAAAVGVVSVAARRPNRFEMGPVAPPPNSGFLGISLEPGDEDRPVIAKVTPKSAAEKAGLKEGDVVLAVGNRRMTNTERLISTIRSFKAGEVVKIKVRRGEEEKVVTATLDKPPSDLFNRGDRMNAMGSELSRRRTGFPVILQHDTVLRPKDCGGPLLDLDGKAMGINIARAGRTESYAIPAENVRELLADLKSGKLAPREDPTKPESDED